LADAKLGLGAQRILNLMAVTLRRGNACSGAPAPRNRPLERTRLVTTLERGNQKKSFIMGSAPFRLKRHVDFLPMNNHQPGRVGKRLHRLPTRNRPQPREMVGKQKDACPPA